MPSTPSPLARALALEVGRLERLRLRAWQALSIAIVAAALTLAAASGTPGLTSAAVGVVSFAWFSVARVALKRDRYGVALQLVTLVVEQCVPWGIYVAVLVTAGADEAARVWGPPLAYTGMLILTTLKLSPRYSIASGFLGAFIYVSLSWWFVRPNMNGNVVETVGAGGELVRAGMLAMGGCVVAVVAQGLRNAVGGVVSTLRAQDLFGKYRLEREIASGGMGVVWLATYCPEGGFARSAAVKLVHPHLAKDAAFVDAFRREAELCARLVHQNIVQVFDFGRVDDRFFLAMEFVDGPTLRDVLRRASAANVRIPPPIAGAITRQILAGLHFAHVDAHDSSGQRLRVIHRDLAPSNILLSHSGEVKLTDFGIARPLFEQTAAHTQTIAGHFDHMAPEQATAGAIDERTDLFCTAVLLWEMLTNKSLFRRDNEPATLAAVANAVVPAPSTFVSELDPFDAFFQRALAKDPAQRFQTAKEMSAAVLDVCGRSEGDAIARFLGALPAIASSSSRANGGDGDSQPETRKLADRRRVERDARAVDDLERDTTLFDRRT